jgi:uncharacterized membrane protein
MGRAEKQIVEASAGDRLSILVALVAGHVAVAGIWASLLVWVSVLTNASDAFYYVLTSYTTLGYGDLLLSGRWRIVGPILAVDGVLMFGISTAALVAAITSTFAAAKEPPGHRPRREGTA